MILLGKRSFFNLSLNLRHLPLLLLTKRLLLQRARSNMVPFNFALEANDLGQILDLFLLLELNPSPLLSLGRLCTLNMLSSVGFPS